jgi:hypothetical protein
VIHNGHHRADVWKMTPRQISAWQQLGYRRKLGEQADLISLLRAAQADGRSYQKFIRKLRDESE